MKTKNLNKSNTKGFFLDMTAGDVFTASFTMSEVRLKANKAGFEIKHLGEKSYELVALPNAERAKIPTYTISNDALGQKTYRVLRPGDIDGFFERAEVGMEFAFLGLTEKRVWEIAARKGWHVEMCNAFPPDSIVRITGRDDDPAIEHVPAPEPAPAAAEKSGYTPAEGMMSVCNLLLLRMGQGSLESRAGWIIARLLEKNLRNTLVNASNVMQKEKFEQEFGADVDSLVKIARPIENVEFDGNGLISASLVAVLASGLVGNNYSILAKSGLERDIEQWCTADAGAIKRIDSIRLSDRVIDVVTLRTKKEEDWFALAGNSGLRFAKCEDLILHAMFGDHAHTVGTLYRSVKAPAAK